MVKVPAAQWWSEPYLQGKVKGIGIEAGVVVIVGIAHTAVTSMRRLKLRCREKRRLGLTAFV